MRKVFKLMCSLIGFAFAVVLIAKLFPVSAAESSFEITDGMYDSYTSTDEYIDSYKFGSYAKKESDVITATQDDAIVNIIPKELFSIEGNYAYYGSEYGFVIKTVYLEEEKAYYSDVLVIDFDTEIIVNSDNTVFYQYIVNDLFEYDFFYSNNNDYFKYGDFEIASSSGFVVPALGSNLSKNKTRNIYYSSIKNYYYMNNKEALNYGDKDYSANEDNGGYILAAYNDYLFTRVKNGYYLKDEGVCRDAALSIAGDVIFGNLIPDLISKFLSGVPVVGWIYSGVTFTINSSLTIIDAVGKYNTYIPGKISKDSYITSIDTFGDKEQQIANNNQLVKIGIQEVNATALDVENNEYYTDENITFTYYLGGLAKNEFEPTEFKSFCEFDLNIELDSFGYSINEIDSIEYFSLYPYAISNYNYEEVLVNKDIFVEIPRGKSNFVIINVPVSGYYELVTKSNLELIFKNSNGSCYFEANTNYNVEIVAKNDCDSGRVSVRLAPKSSNTINLETGKKYKIDSDKGIYNLVINEENCAFNIPSKYKIYDFNYKVVRADYKCDNDNYYYILNPTEKYYIYMPNSYDSLHVKEIANIDFENDEIVLNAILEEGMYAINVNETTFFKVTSPDFDNISVVGFSKDKINKYYYGVITSGKLYIIVKNKSTEIRVFNTMFFYSSSSEILLPDGNKYFSLTRGEVYTLKIENKMKNIKIDNALSAYKGTFEVEIGKNEVSIKPIETLSIGKYPITIVFTYEFDGVTVKDIVNLEVYVNSGGKANFTQSVFIDNDKIYVKIKLKNDIGYNNSIMSYEKIEYKFYVEYFDIEKYLNPDNNEKKGFESKGLFVLNLDKNTNESEIEILNLNDFYNLHSLAKRNILCPKDIIEDLFKKSIKIIPDSGKISIGDELEESLIIDNKDTRFLQKEYSYDFDFIFDLLDDSNTIYVSNSRQLLNAFFWIDTIDNKVNISLTDDITFDNPEDSRYTTNLTRTYYGNFIGNNKSISRLKFDNGALFDCLYGKIENLKINNYFVKCNCESSFISNKLEKGGEIYNVDIDFGNKTLNNSSSTFGIIAGKNNGIISECDVIANLNFNNSITYAGGIVGYTTNNVINCSFNGNIDLNQKSYSFVGGIAGFATTYVSIYEKSNVSIINCRANIVLKSKDDAYEGGIVGATSSAQDGGMMSSSPNSTYPLISECEMNGSISGGEFAGGIVGYMQSGKATLNNSYFKATDISTGSGASIGGIAGCGHVLENNVVKSFNASNSAVGTNVGTIAGEVVKSTAYVYNNSCYESNISVTGEKTNNIGGIVGYILDVSSVNYNVINNLKIEGKAYLGGAVGFMYTGNVNNNEINGTISGRKMSTTTYKGNAHLIMGGLVGYAEKGEIRYNKGNVTINYLSATENSNSLKVCIGSSIGVATGYVSVYSPLLYTNLNYDNLITYSWTTGALWWKETHYYNQAQFVNSYNSVIGLHL